MYKRGSAFLFFILFYFYFKKSTIFNNEVLDHSRGSASLSLICSANDVATGIGHFRCGLYLQQDNCLLASCADYQVRDFCNYALMTHCPTLFITAITRVIDR
jgi:hypothetical protein